MRAIRIHAFGGPEVLALDEVETPEPGPGEVLIRVHAAGVNPPDWYARIGFSNIPEAIRPNLGLPFTPGSDVSGVIAALGPDVTGWAVGDEVFGLIRFPSLPGKGAKAYAEFVTSPAGHLARKPESLSHIQAAAIPMAGLTALQLMRYGPVVLINGAAGGVGHFMVQLAKMRECRVIAVASGRHEQFLRELGADEFIDYTRQQAHEVAREVDVVADTVGGPHGSRFLPVIKEGGAIVPVFFGEYDPEQAARRGITIHAGQVRSDGAQLEVLAGLADSGLRVGIDSVFDLADAAKAHHRAEQGHIQGKIVLRVIEG